MFVLFVRQRRKPPEERRSRKGGGRRLRPQDVLRMVAKIHLWIVIVVFVALLTIVTATELRRFAVWAYMHLTAAL